MNLGIDLGTSNTLAIYRQNGNFQHIDFGNGFLLPSYVSNEGNYFTAGLQAKKKWAKPSQKKIYRRFKLEMGMNKIYEIIGNLKITPEFLTTEILKEVKKSIPPNEKIESVVITVPHGWETNRRESTLLAAKESGLEVQTLLSEPIAAAAYYVFLNSVEKSEILVCDMGGGTFDVSLCKVERKKITVIDSARSEIAGNEADALICQHFINEFSQAKKIKINSLNIITTEDAGIRRWLLQAEETKENLSLNFIEGGNPTEDVQLIYQNNLFSFIFDYQKMIQLLKPIFDKAIETVETLLAQNTQTKVDFVVFAGGMGNLKHLQKIISQKIGVDFDKVKTFGRESDKSIVKGAALVANKEIQIQEVLLHKIALVLNEKKLIALTKGETLPTHRVSVSKKNKIILTLERMGNLNELIVTLAYLNEQDFFLHKEEITFRIPQNVKSGSKYDFYFQVNENGVLTVEIEGEVEGTARWQGKIINRNILIAKG